MREVGTGDGLNGSSESVLFGRGAGCANLGCRQGVALSVEWPSGMSNEIDTVLGPFLGQGSEVRIVEPEPLSLNILGFTQNSNGQTQELNFQLHGDATTYNPYHPPIPCYYAHYYAIETSADLLTWTPASFLGDTFIPSLNIRAYRPGNYSIALSDVGSANSGPAARFFRARDVGFQGYCTR
jgi:hypothetical protein